MNNADSRIVLNLKDVHRTFVQGSERLQILKGISLSVHSGEIVALIGPSGVGKSTLLHIAGLLEHADSGNINVADVACAHLGDDLRTSLRRRHIGFVYQYHHLLPEFSALENIVLPQMIAGLAPGEARSRAGDLLAMMGLSARATHRPAELSGGEQQRVAVARALANMPSVLLADEPTGNLDSETADRVFAEILSLVRQTGIGALIATHNPDLAARMDRILRLDGGHLVEGAR